MCCRNWFVPRTPSATSWCGHRAIWRPCVCLSVSGSNCRKVRGFAESDMIHKQQVGHSLPDIVSGLCEALVRNYLNNVAKGKQILAPAVFQGGVAANIGMRRAFERALGGYEVVVPEHFDVMGGDRRGDVGPAPYRIVQKKHSLCGMGGSGANLYNILPGMLRVSKYVRDRGGCTQLCRCCKVGRKVREMGGYEEGGS